MKAQNQNVIPFKTTAILLTLLTLAGILNAQQFRSDTIAHGLGKVTCITRTPLGDIILGFEDGTLRSFDSTMQIEKANNQSIGISEPKTIDATNPKQLLVFYPNTQSIIQLSKELKPIRQIDLQILQAGKISKIKRSRDGNIWIVSDEESKFMKINLDARIFLTCSVVKKDSRDFIMEIFESNDLISCLVSDEMVHHFDKKGKITTSINLSEMGRKPTPHEIMINDFFLGQFESVEPEYGEYFDKNYFNPRFQLNSNSKKWYIIKHNRI